MPWRPQRGASRIGLIADETNRAHAAEIATALGAVGSVRRLTITRGINGRGAKDLGLLPNLGRAYASVTQTGKTGRQILEGLAAGEMRGLLMLGPNPALEAAGDLLERAVRKAACVVAFDTRPGVVSRYATVLFPGHAIFEKAGSVTNIEGRVQRIRAGLPPGVVQRRQRRACSPASPVRWERSDGGPVIRSRSTGCCVTR